MYQKYENKKYSLLKYKKLSTIKNVLTPYIYEKLPKNPRANRTF